MGHVPPYQLVWNVLCRPLRGLGMLLAGYVHGINPVATIVSPSAKAFVGLVLLMLSYAGRFYYYNAQ